MKIKSIKRKPKTWLYPSAVEREYVKSLEAITDNVIKSVNEFCKKQQESYRLIIRQDGLSDWLESVLTELLSAMMFSVSDSEVTRLVSGLLGETNRFNQKQFHQTLKKAYGVDIFTAEPWLREQLELVELQNIKLIKSIPTQLHEKLRYKFIDAAQKGKRWEEVAKEIEELTDVTRKRARLIARDQIGKLNAQLTQLRQKQIGVKSYIWRTSLDERVRKLHVGREGEQFDWDNPPNDGHPGEPINCRCYAEAVLPDLDELLQSQGTIATKGENSEVVNIIPEVTKDLPINQSTIELMDKLKSDNVDYRPVHLLKEKLSTESIISKLAGGDETKGSCASLALSYIGNRVGLDVTDYRGGKSREFFSLKDNTRKLFSTTGVKTKIFDVVKEAGDVAKLLKTELELDKEYYLSTGGHAAIVRRGSNGLEYLELQSAIKNGWMPFDRYGSVTKTLSKRFGCRVSSQKYRAGGKIHLFTRKMMLAEVDSFNSIKADLKEILGYLNTTASEQKKGNLGGLK